MVMFPSTCGINNSDILPINDNSIRNDANNNNPILQLNHLKCKVYILSQDTHSCISRLQKHSTSHVSIYTYKVIV
jgi:hypothetical protein